ncbi:type II pantothenate kinase [Oceanobacillus kimchii]|uniref:type II pantothenate kinase n=1 Tax=Oceanobacillus kimchii TaxID=746691 RepID=UPI0009874096|nr:type II pantothenate kinase [Oceanobacillus kimchii]
MKRIGIDAGGSLVKVAFEEKGKMHLKTYSSYNMDEVIQWLKTLSPYASFHITGGRTNQLNLEEYRVYTIPEFNAIVEGTSYLLHQERKLPQNNYLLVNIGTGTSIFYNENRISGTGIGGGLLTGLGKLLTNESDYNQLIQMAKQGDRTKSDLLVRDIYNDSISPIDETLTAANFGKVGFNHSGSKEDHIAALIQLIGETILLISNAAAQSVNTSQIVFIGGTLTNNQPLKEVLLHFQEKMNYTATFLNNGGHAGAIGAMLST